MARRIGLDGLDDAIAKILKDYSDEIARGTVECVKKAAKAGVQALKDVSPRRTGVYAEGWTAEVKTGRLNATATLYNAARPGLAHLLEHGHVCRNGTGWFGDVPAHVHIAPVEERLIAAFRDGIKVVTTK